MVEPKTKSIAQEGDWIILSRDDPRIMGYYYDPAYLEVVAILESEEKAIQEHRKYKSMLKFAGTDSMSYNSPIPYERFIEEYSKFEIVKPESPDETPKRLTELGCRLYLFKGDPKHAGRQFTDEYDRDFDNYDEWKDYQSGGW